MHIYDKLNNIKPLNVITLATRCRSAHLKTWAIVKTKTNMTLHSGKYLA